MSRTLLLAASLLGACSGVADCGQTAQPEAKTPAVNSVSLRFRPADGAQYREHWVLDLALPGEGMRRDLLSFDVAWLGRMDQGSYAMRHTVRERNTLQDGRAIAEPTLRGVSITRQWASDHSVVGELGVSAQTLELETALRSLVETASFGMLIEYPDQAVAIGDSWSIEPRTHAVPGGLTATLRPTYTLEGIERRGSDVEAVIAVDVQVDLIPTNVVESVTIEGGGSASGTLRVSVADGVLRDAHTVLHFSQEITAQGSEVLGYREISATAHVFTTASNQAPDLRAEPVKLEPPDDDTDRDCVQSLASAAERVGNSEGHQRVHLVSALHGEGLPAAHGGRVLRDSAMSLVLSDEPPEVELDGARVALKDLGAAVRDSGSGRALYVYDDADLPLERLRGLMAALPRSSAPRLVVRDPAAAAPPPKASRWLEERLRLALAATDPLERQIRLHGLLLAHVVLCEPAQDAFRSALNAGARGSTELPGQIVQAFAKCGCTTTNLEGLEATLSAIFGSPDLRSLMLPRRTTDPRWSLPTVRDFARTLSAG
ncbi:MAG TPA: hypothetical protein VJR89_17110 [Polyangiales bacterium]|nr:hypothetical protein [Polyangiales bacterium]